MVKVLFIMLVLVIGVMTIVYADNQSENKAFADAIKACQKELGFKLSKDQIQRVHRVISKQGYTYHDIIEECVGLFG